MNWFIIFFAIIFCISICALVISCLAFYKKPQPSPPHPHSYLPQIILSSKYKFQEKLTGRICQFHGTNIVVKGAPWIPYPFNLVNQDNFEELFDNSVQTKYSLVRKDFELLQKYGINCIRLGVMMPGVYPDSKNSGNTPYVVDNDYLNGIKTLIIKAGEYGIYTVLDFHQDVLSSIFCGEGVPIWFAKKLLGPSPTHDWPYPLAGKYILSPLWRLLDNSLRKITKAGNVTHAENIQTNCYKLSSGKCLTRPAPNTPNGPPVDKDIWWDATVKTIGEPEAKTIAVIQKLRRDSVDIGDETILNVPVKNCRKGRKIPLPLDGDPKIYGINGCNWSDSSERFTPNYPIGKQCKCANSTPMNLDGQVLYGSWQVLQAFENLYKPENTKIVGQFWLDVLTYLQPVHSNILCIDIINEPLFGNVYQHIWKALNANNDYLKPFYETIIEQVHSVYKDILISFEPGLSLQSFTQPPKGNNLIYNRHYYSAISGDDPVKFITAESMWANNNKLGFIISEFASPAYDKKNFLKIASFCDQNFIPWMYWEFKSFTATTCATPPELSQECPPWNFGHYRLWEWYVQAYQKLQLFLRK